MTSITVICLLAVPAAQADGWRVSERDQAVWHSAQAGQTARRSRSETCRSARKALAYYIRVTNEWRAKMGAEAHQGPPTGGKPIARCPRIRHLAKRWREKARAARADFDAWYARRYEKWRCIHEHEGAWNSNTGNGYYGGLQMTTWFQQTYGPEFWRRYGTANRWPVWAQLLAAERAWRECECFRQWGTAGMCGLR